MVDDRTLLGVLTERAKRQGESPFVTSLRERRTYSYQEAGIFCLKLDVFLRRKQFRPGARIVLIAENSWSCLPLLAACASHGLTLVPLNPKLHARELEFILKDVEPVLILVDDPFSSIEIPPGNRVELLSKLPAMLEESSAADSPPIQAPPRPTPALLIYTSGTSDSSKAVMLTEANLLSNARTFVSTYGLTSADRLLCVLPFYHMNAIMLTGCAPLLAGAHVLVSDLYGYQNAKFYWNTVAENKVTVCSVVPSIMATLLYMHPTSPLFDLSAVKFAFSGAAPLSESLWRTFEERFGFPVYQGYGLTETTCWATFTPPGTPRQYSTVGLPLGCEIRTAKNGEVLIRGPIVMQGYFKNARLTRELQTKDGFFKTGDVGFLDAQGFLTISCRKKELIIKNGIKIAPGDIDSVLEKHADIQECKTLGLKDELVGECIATVCVVKSDRQPPALALKQFARERLSAFKVPDRVFFMDYLPKSATGKVSVAKLRDVVSGELSTSIFKKLNTWRNKRAHPSDSDEIKRIIQNSLLTGRAIPFAAYWGCGTRAVLADSDRMAMDRLRDFIHQADWLPHVTATLTLVLTDTHAMLNGKPNARWETYFAQIARLAHEQGFHSVFLSQLWYEQGHNFSEWLEDLDSTEFSPEEYHIAFGELGGKFATLVEQAGRHSETEAPVLAAQKYLRACRRDSAVMLKKFPATIFLTYNGPDSGMTLPAMSTMYIYSTKPKFSEKPWFCAR